MSELKKHLITSGIMASIALFILTVSLMPTEIEAAVLLAFLIFLCSTMVYRMIWMLVDLWDIKK